jgi:hypothetical protein
MACVVAIVKFVQERIHIESNANVTVEHYNQNNQTQLLQLNQTQISSIKPTSKHVIVLYHQKLLHKFYQILHSNDIFVPKNDSTEENDEFNHCNQQTTQLFQLLLIED